MKVKTEVRSQIEFDACIKLGHIAIVIGCYVEARGNSSVEARGNSSVVAWENSRVVARENSRIEARENSNVEAWGNSSIEARDNCSVEARGSVFIRLWSARKIKASAHCSIIIHGIAGEISGGNQTHAMPAPVIGSEWCDYFGIDSEADFVVPNIDKSIYEAIANGGELDMSSWHKEGCNTTHCRAGWAIMLAGEAGKRLEKKYGPEIAGKMIYAASRLDKPLPNFFANNASVIAEIKADAGK